MLLKDALGNPIHDENGKEVKKETGIIIAFYFWMQNRLQFYQRNYKKFQDVLGDIGGLSSIVLTLATIINFLFTDFIILLDTEELLLSSDNKNYKSSFNKKRPTIFRKANEIMYPPKRIFYSSDGNNENDSQSQQKSLNNIGIKNEVVKNKNYKEFQNSNNINYYNSIYYLNNKNDKEDEDILKSIGIKGKILRDNYVMCIKGKQNEISNKPNKKQNFNWFSYIKYMALCCKYNPKISFYEDLRTKLISEENIIQNYIDIYNLLDVNKIRK